MNSIRNVESLHHYQINRYNLSKKKTCLTLTVIVYLSRVPIVDDGSRVPPKACFGLTCTKPGH